MIDCFVAFQRKNHMRLNLPTAKFIKNKFIADKKYIDYITKLLKRNENYLAIDSEDDDFYFLASFNISENFSTLDLAFPNIDYSYSYQSVAFTRSQIKKIQGKYQKPVRSNLLHRRNYEKYKNFMIRNFDIKILKESERSCYIQYI